MPSQLGAFVTRHKSLSVTQYLSTGECVCIIIIFVQCLATRGFVIFIGSVQKNIEFPSCTLFLILVLLPILLGKLFLYVTNIYLHLIKDLTIYVFFLFVNIPISKVTWSFA